MGLFGGDSKKTYTTVTEIVDTKDQRVAVEGGVGSLIAPGATVGGTGAVTAAPYSQVSQTISHEGYLADDVQTMLDSVFAAGQADRSMVLETASIFGGALESQAAKLTDVLGAIQAPTQSALGSLVPLLVVAAILWFLWSLL